MFNQEGIKNLLNGEVSNYQHSIMSGFLLWSNQFKYTDNEFAYQITEVPRDTRMTIIYEAMDRRDLEWVSVMWSLTE